MTENAKNIVLFVVQIVFVVSLIGFFVYLAKNDLLKWKMLTILALMFLLTFFEILAIVGTMSFFTKHRDFGFGGGIILLGAVIGYLYVPFGIYAIHVLSKSLNIMWPIYVTAVLFMVILVSGIKKWAN